MKGRSEKSLALAPEKMRPWHQQVADMWIDDPRLSQGEIARRMGRTEGWLSVIVNCDAFQEYLAVRKEELLDPILKASVEERFRAIANVAADKFMERMQLGAVSNRELLSAMDVTAKGLGMGPAAKQPMIQQNLYIVPAPQKTPDSSQWAQVVEAQVGVKQG